MRSNHPAKLYGVNKLVWLLGFVLLINIVQAYSSALLNDEPYYWIYSKYLSWGYFDHPPLIALLIKLGSAILGGEIGVRLFPLILGSGTFYLICKIIAHEIRDEINFRLVALLLLSSLFLNLYSFLAIPDTPMLFLGTLFLYWYRKYLNQDNIANAALLGLITALLLYAKYHGVLIIAFTLMSNLKLLRRQSFYLIVVIALILYAPHIYWEIQHDYPTIRFQFVGRTGQLGIQHTLSYLGEQAAVTGPVILLLFSILYQPQNQFQKSLKYNVIGVFAFFLISSVKAMVNVHWTAIAWPPMLCLGYLYLSRLKTGIKLLYGLLIINLIAVIVLRFDLSLNWFGIANFNDKNPRLMAATLQKKANGRPLVFDNTYNEPSYFTFYTGQACFAVNDIWYKKTQYNYLPSLENKFQNKAVAYVSDGPVNKTSREVVIPRGKKYYLTFVNNFTSFAAVNVRLINPVSNLNHNQETAFKILLDASDNDAAQLKSTKAFLILTFTNTQTQARVYYKYPLPAAAINGKPFELIVRAPVAGIYRYQFSVVAKQHIGVGFNSNIYYCKVN